MTLDSLLYVIEHGVQGVLSNIDRKLVQQIQQPRYYYGVMHSTGYQSVRSPYLLKGLSGLHTVQEEDAPLLSHFDEMENKVLFKNNLIDNFAFLY